MLDKRKVNFELGKQVFNFLKEKGVESPLIDCILETGVEKQIKDAFRIIMKALNLDLDDDSLSRTPERVAKMYIQEVFYGLDYRNFPKVSSFENKMNYDEMIIERNIKVHSFCEHHFVPIIGIADVGYISNGKVIGLSKLNRIVDFFSRRPQVQERLTEQIFWALSFILGTENIAVRIKANHFCVRMRGIEDINSDTVTTKLGGVFKQPEVRQEFLNQIK